VLLIQNFVKSAATLRKVQRESAVLQHILEECVEMVTSQNAPLPRSNERTILLCEEDYVRLLRVLERILSKKGRFSGC
jgi:uncharacterized protein (DUF1778 family)